MRNTILLPLFAMLLAGCALAQQAPSAPAAPDDAQAPSPVQFAAGTVIPAQLSKSVDAKKLKVGDKIEAKTSADMLSNGKIVMPRETKILGHVTSVKAHSKESPDSTVGIAFEGLVMKDGRELPLQASLQAIGAPISAFSASDGAPVSPVGIQPGGMGAGSAPSGGSMGGGQRSGAPAPSSYPTGGMPTGPGSNAPRSSATGALSASSEGVIGLKDLSLSATPQASVISSSNKNVHLDSGTQLMLKVQ